MLRGALVVMGAILMTVLSAGPVGAQSCAGSACSQPGTSVGAPDPKPVVVLGAPPGDPPRVDPSVLDHETSRAAAAPGVAAAGGLVVACALGLAVSRRRRELGDELSAPMPTPGLEPVGEN